MITRLEHFFEDMWRGLGQFSLEKRELWEDLIANPRTKRRATRKKEEELFTRECSDEQEGMLLN